MKTLLINAHPDFTNHNHFSVQLQEKFVEKYREKFSDGELTVINLYEMNIPRIEADGLLAIWDKQRVGEMLSPVETVIAQQSAAFLAQFKEHHRIVISTPLHNFNITSRLKDYMDNILIARETFKYTESGSVGLMTDDYRLLLMQASGGIYTNNDRYTALDFAPNYLKEVFTNIMGFNQFDLVRAQGTNVLSADEVWETADLSLEEGFRHFYEE
ncbi:FMN-dependent NADH-azoreductase [Neobacillus drentensis]|uniref:FMN-dependent NADH-azoreductase n=1 Tax=Neobacillus drentensis TaxID=220684 RepID=UPI002FFF2CC8